MAICRDLFLHLAVLAGAAPLRHPSLLGAAASIPMQRLLQIWHGEAAARAATLTGEPIPPSAAGGASKRPAPRGVEQQPAGAWRSSTKCCGAVR